MFVYVGVCVCVCVCVRSRFWLRAGVSPLLKFWTIWPIFKEDVESFVPLKNT